MSNFDSVAHSIKSQYKGIDNMQLAPNAVVTYIYPLTNNEKAIGHDLLKN